MPVFDPHIGLWFLPFTLPIGIWVSWSDMKFMKIPNKAVLALLGVYLLVGPLVLPFNLWIWGWGLAGIALAAGFVGSAAGLFGAGDAKFAAAMAPFFVGSDLRLVLALFSACLLAAFASHRLMRRVPRFRAATPDWESWTHRDFPMGLALSGTLVFFPLLGLLLR
jgi:prepilin peptidase CpaA